MPSISPRISIDLSAVWRFIVEQRLVLALLLAAGALVFDGCAHRYQTYTIKDFTIGTTDRLTGAVEICAFDRTESRYSCWYPDLAK